MWQCTKCQAFQLDPKSNQEHVLKCKVVLKENHVNLGGWQSILLDGIPKTRSGRILEWNHLLDISIKKP